MACSFEAFSLLRGTVVALVTPHHTAATNKSPTLWKTRQCEDGTQAEKGKKSATPAWHSRFPLLTTKGQRRWAAAAAARRRLLRPRRPTPACSVLPRAYRHVDAGAAAAAARRPQHVQHQGRRAPGLLCRRQGAGGPAARDAGRVVHAPDIVDGAVGQVSGRGPHAPPRPPPGVAPALGTDWCTHSSPRRPTCCHRCTG